MMLAYRESGSVEADADLRLIVVHLVIVHRRILVLCFIVYGFLLNSIFPIHIISLVYTFLSIFFS